LSKGPNKFTAQCCGKLRHESLLGIMRGDAKKQMLVCTTCFPHLKIASPVEIAEAAASATATEIPAQVQESAKIIAALFSPPEVLV
jgi:hypothetical protein